MHNLINKILGKKEKNTGIEPDYPCPYCYKTAWYAIKDETPISVIEKLSLDIVCESNWKSGLDTIQKKGNNVFVSPQMNGYVLILNVINADYDLVKNHAKLFSKLQYFCSHRVVDYYAWAKFINGEVIRAYAYNGGSGEVNWNEGIFTKEELELDFDKFPVSTDLWNEDDMLPDEENVIDIAKAWGIDPTFADSEYEKSTGYICRFSSH